VTPLASPSKCVACTAYLVMCVSLSLVSYLRRKRGISPAGVTSGKDRRLLFRVIIQFAGAFAKASRKQGPN
jgi:hypothetical protein